MRSSIMIDIDDPRAGKVAEVLSNNTCKKILAALAERELSEGEISSQLNIPLNTVGYNVKKLADAGLIEANKKFFWSSKGKRINKYKVSNKRIIISPHVGVRGVVPALIGAIVIAFGIKIWSARNFVARGTTAMKDGTALLAESSTTRDAVTTISRGSAQQSDQIFSGWYNSLANAPELWAWFLLGAFVTIEIYLIWNFLKGGEK